MNAERVFDPKRYNPTNPPVDPAEVAYSYDDGFRYLRRSHGKTLMVWTDGACHLNGQPDARASAAAFFGAGSRLNRAFTLGPSERHTSQNAELKAALLALKLVMVRCKHRRRNRKPWWNIRRVVVIADSETVCRGITEWVRKWERNGWLNSEGNPVANAAKFRQLHRLIGYLAKLHIKVLFWQVPRCYNTAADDLAKAALQY